MEQNSNGTHDLHHQPQLSQFVNSAMSLFRILNKAFCNKNIERTTDSVEARTGSLEAKLSLS